MLNILIVEDDVTFRELLNYNLKNKTILFSPVHDVLDSKKLSKWILEDGLNVRMQIQLHKHIWNPETKGV